MTATAPPERQTIDIKFGLRRPGQLHTHRAMIRLCRQERGIGTPLDRTGFLDRLERMIEENYLAERTEENRHALATLLNVVFAVFDTDTDTEEARERAATAPETVDRAALQAWADHHRNRPPTWVDRLDPAEAYHLGQAEKAIALETAIRDGAFGNHLSGPRAL